VIYTEYYLFSNTSLQKKIPYSIGLSNFLPQITFCLETTKGEAIEILVKAEFAAIPGHKLRKQQHKWKILTAAQ
jgi:hypothetical protein